MTPEERKEYYKMHAQRVKEQEGITKRKKYIDAVRRASRNNKYRANAILSIKHLFGTCHLI